MNELAPRYRELINVVRRMGSTEGINLIAFSGGVDSSLVAKAVHDAFPLNSEAVIALSPSVQRSMQQQARDIAARIGIFLREIQTEEYRDPDYIANEGMSCYVCKSHIYAAMRTVAAEAETRNGAVRLFNGSNAEDLLDPTRVGLRAAREFEVCSPLEAYSKAQVRELSRYAGLPNWNAAATPCLRSRLHTGIPATPEHLARIEHAEDAVRMLFNISVETNFRVRHMPGDAAMIEIDKDRIVEIDLDRCRPLLEKLGFMDVDMRAFRSGAVSAAPETVAVERDRKG
ncbi:MAG: TIGR00268 family protein [Bacteroidetes bacterium]|nr:TIGR00268 family protein [Bacteroidota bacterium]